MEENRKKEKGRKGEREGRKTGGKKLRMIHEDNTKILRIKVHICA